jgi:hypothetical protein
VRVDNRAERLGRILMRRSAMAKVIPAIRKDTPVQLVARAEGIIRRISAENQGGFSGNKS